MEKLLGLFAPIIGWSAWLQKDKVSKATCKATHDGICGKLDMIQADLTMIKEHLMGSKDE